MQDVTVLSGKALAQLIQKKQISCVEVMQAHIDQLALVNPSLNAVIQRLSSEEALHQAMLADKAVAKKKKLGLLHGVPITIKDARQTKGFLCSFGNKSPMNFIAKEDATVVARLKAAGAIVTGITNIPDFSLCFDTDNKLYGRTNNPYDLKRSPGGSSGGAAAIIAAGGSYLGIGADGGGGIRQPAHNCGIAALKPTLGLISDYGLFPKNGSGGLFNQLTSQGPMARYVDDLIYVLPIIAGPDGRDLNVAPIKLRNPSLVNLKALRVAVYTHNGVVAPRADVTEVVNRVALMLENEVKSVEENYPQISKEHYSIFEELFFYGGDCGQWIRDLMDIMRITEVAEPFQAVLDRASICDFSVTEFRRRIVLIERFKFYMMDFMSEYDVIICPVATTPANLYGFKNIVMDGFDLTYDLTYNIPYSIARWPSAVVRCGTSPEGLPIGVQIVAKSWREDIVLAVAKRLEELFGGWQPPALINHIRHK